MRSAAAEPAEQLREEVLGLRGGRQRRDAQRRAAPKASRLPMS